VTPEPPAAGRRGQHDERDADRARHRQRAPLLLDFAQRRGDGNGEALPAGLSRPQHDAPAAAVGGDQRTTAVGRGQRRLQRHRHRRHRIPERHTGRVIDRHHVFPPPHDAEHLARRAAQVVVLGELAVDHVDRGEAEPLE
jgi:hypothetical protein